MASSNAAATVTYEQAQTLQRELECTLQKLEHAGLLRETAGHEVRTIVAEDIAGHFGERYRSFPAGTRSEGLEIRRNTIPKQCVLKGRAEDHLPVAKKKQRKKQQQKPAQPKAAGVATTTKSSSENTVAPVSGEFKQRVQKWVSNVPNGSSRSGSPENKVAAAAAAAAAKNWSGSLTSASDARWDAIFAAKSRGSASSNGSPLKSGDPVKIASPIKAASPIKSKTLESVQVVQPIQAGTLFKIASPVNAADPDSVLQSLQPNGAPRRSATPPMANSDDSDLISFSP